MLPCRGPRRPAPVGEGHQPAARRGHPLRGRRRLTVAGHSFSLPDAFRRGRLGRRVDDDDGAVDTRDQARRVPRWGPAPPALLPLLPPGPGRCAAGNGGTVLAGALAWGGNTRFAFERITAPTVRAWCGHNPMAAEYVLDPGATFSTPEQIWAWSSDGDRVPQPAAAPLGAHPRSARRGRAAPDRGEQLGGHLLLLRYRTAPRAHRANGRLRRRSLPPRRRLVRHVTPPQRRHRGPGRLAGERGEAAGWPRPVSSSGPASVGSASGSGWSPRW